MTIALWQAGLLFLGMLIVLAVIDLVYQLRRRRKWEAAHLEALRRFGMAKMKEIPAPEPHSKG